MERLLSYLKALTSLCQSNPFGSPCSNQPTRLPRPHSENSSPLPVSPVYDMGNFHGTRFDIHHTGFLPHKVPLSRLPLAYESWESALDGAFQVLSKPGDVQVSERERSAAEAWRRSIREMAVLSVDYLKSDLRGAQRAHHVLTFLQQFYVQSLPPSKLSTITIPASIAVPLVAVSRHLSIAPIVTYADTVLWNYELKDPSLPLSISNIGIRDLFTGDPQEEHFFLTSARIEIRGWEAIAIMNRCVNALQGDRPEGGRNDDLTQMAADLDRLAVVMSDISDILDSVRDGCDPRWFYFTFRPWIRGADQGADSPAWFYEGVDGDGVPMHCSGPSAGQSALMHAFDVFLGVEHPQNSGGGCAAMRGKFNPAFDPHGVSRVLMRCPVSGQGQEAVSEPQGALEEAGSSGCPFAKLLLAEPRCPPFDPRASIPTPLDTPLYLTPLSSPRVIKQIQTDILSSTSTKPLGFYAPSLRLSIPGEAPSVESSSNLELDADIVPLTLPPTITSCLATPPASPCGSESRMPLSSLIFNQTDMQSPEPGAVPVPGATLASNTHSAGEAIAPPSRCLFDSLTPPATPPLSAAIPNNGQFACGSTPQKNLDPNPRKLDTSFIKRMRFYMPGPHYEFLEYLASHSIRPLVSKNLILQESYNRCIASVVKFRDAHIRVVTKYVICPARSASILPAKLDLGTCSKPVRGTGGTSLVPLLKIYRNNTLLKRIGSPF